MPRATQPKLPREHVSPVPRALLTVATTMLEAGGDERQVLPAAMLQMLNDDRKAKGLPPLKALP
jgi:hypothetical protein